MKYKNKFTKASRRKLCDKVAVVKPKAPSSKSILTLGSLNVNGLDTEAHWAVSQLVEKHTIDVRILVI